MGLQKNVTSARTGAVLGFHEVLTVNAAGDKVSVVVASYVDKAAKDAGKNFAEAAPHVFDYDGSAINKTMTAFAQDLLKGLPEFAGAVEVA